MKDTRDAPPPWLSAEAAALIEADRQAAGPSPALRRKIWRQTARTLAVGVVLAPSTAGGKSLLGMKLAGKAALGKAGAALGTGATTTTATATLAAGATVTAKIALVLAVSAAAVTGTTLAVVHRTPATATGRAPAAISARAAQRRARPEPPRAPPPPVAATMPPLADVPELPPAPPPRAEAPAPAAVGVTMPISATAGRSAEHERRLLDRALAAIGRRDLPSARDLLDRHAAIFPAGRLVEEREALRVSVYAAVGDDGAAARQAARFRARFPHSVFRISVDAAVPTAPVTAPR